MTIGERAEKISEEYDRFYFSEDLRDDIVHALTEQDRIARNEERERCIQAAENYLLNLWKEDDCDTTSIGFTLYELRKAMEGGNNGY